MISSIKTPGVYVDEIDAFPPSIAQVKTAIPAFIGYTENHNPDLENMPIKIRSLLEYENIFGGAPKPSSITISSTNPVVASLTESDYKLYNSLRLFFDNGGGECYMLSVGSYDDSISESAFTDALAENGPIEKKDEPTLLLFPDAISLEASALKNVQVQALAQCARMMDRFAILDVQENNQNSSTSKLDESCATFRENIGMSHLKYGAAYYPYVKGHFTHQYRFLDIDDEVDFEDLYSTNTNLVSAISAFKTYLDNPGEDTMEEILIEESKVIAQIPVYSDILSALNSQLSTLPPSGAIAGIYARTDANRGVWKAPANVSINGIVGLNDEINDALQMDMNIDADGKSINALRKFTGKGHLVWGARTLAGNSNDWRYVNVRRLANMIEESTKKACMQFIFEPNVKQTWVSVKGMIDNYLTTLWNDGALAGSKKEHAFFVSVGLDATMSADDINNGRMIVKIGYAPVRAAEFIILKFTQKQQES